MSMNKEQSDKASGTTSKRQIFLIQCIKLNLSSKLLFRPD